MVVRITAWDGATEKAPSAGASGTVTVTSATHGTTPGLYAFIKLFAFGPAPACTPNSIIATGGTIQNFSVLGNGIEGNFTGVTFSGGTLDGTFLAHNCAVPITDGKVCKVWP